MVSARVVGSKQGACGQRCPLQRMLRRQTACGESVAAFAD